MGEFDLEKFFKNRIRGYSEEMDNDALWKSLDLDNEKKRSPLLFWLFGMSALFTLAFFVPTIFINQDFKIKNGEDLAVKNSRIEFDSKIVAENLSESSMLANESNESSEAIRASEIIGSNATLEISGLNDSSKLSTLNRTDVPVTSVNSSRVDSNLKSQLSKRSIKETYQKNTYSEKSFTATKTLSSTKIVKPKPSKLNLLPFKKLEELVALPTAEARFSNKRILVQNKKIDTESKLMFGIYSGYNFIDRSLSSTRSPEQNNELLELRNSTESVLEMITLGIGLSYDINPSLYFKSGLEYQAINEKFIYDMNSLDTLMANNVIVQQFVTSQFDTTSVREVALAQQSAMETWSNFNHHQLINIPITIGYRFAYNLRWTPHVEGSALINISRKFVGKQLESYSVVEEDPSYFSRNPGFGISFATGFEYRLGPNLNLYTQFRYQKMLQSFTKSELGLSQHYQMYGLRIGINYRLK